MKTNGRSTICAALILSLLCALAPSESPGAAAQAPTHAVAPVPSDRTAALVFIENAGQFPDGARFQVRGHRLTLWLTDNAIWLTALNQASAAKAGFTGGANIKLSFPGANPHPILEPFDRLDTRVSFFTGSDPANWRTDVPVWGGVRFVNLYPDIDLELRGEGGQMVPRLTARADAGLSAVRLRVEGVAAVTVEDDELRLSTPAGELAWPLLRAKGPETKPMVRPRGGSVFEVTAPLAPEDLVPSGTRTPNDNPADLLYSAFLGGSQSDTASGIALDTSGAVYVTGSTESPNFPTTPGAFDSTCGTDGSCDTYYSDAFVAKLDAESGGLAYVTFLGGERDDGAADIAVDGSGAAYVTGDAWSPDFPATLGAFDTTCGTDGYCDQYLIYTKPDAFAVKLNAEGNGLVYATFLGGVMADFGQGIAVHDSGLAYVTGNTWSPDFPTTPGAFDTTCAMDGTCEAYPGGPREDAFVAVLNADGSALHYATYLGGRTTDLGFGIAVDGSGAAYVTGKTFSEDFPTTPGAFDTSHNNSDDAFAVKLNAEGSALLYATYLGGDISDVGRDIAEYGGAVYVTGTTTSDNFPTTPGAFDRDLNGGVSADAFILKLNATGTELEYATFLGGTDVDQAQGIALDDSGAAYVIGTTGSSDLPTTPGAFDRSLAGWRDVFVAKLNAIGSSLLYCSFLGGSNNEDGIAVAVAKDGAAYGAGVTNSPDFPTTPGSFDTSHNGSEDAFVVKLAMEHIEYDYSSYLPLVIWE